MDLRTSVFFDDTTPLDALIAQATDDPVRLSANDVAIAEAGVAKEGEVWSPQLLEYEAWVSSDEDPEKELRTANDVGLLFAGTRSMGYSPEELDRLLKNAMKGSDLARADSSAVVRQTEYGTGDEVDLHGGYTVRECAGGYALVGADLRRFAAAACHEEELVVVLPAYIDDKPVVRVAAEVFARRYVQGVGIRLLIVPDTVKVIAASTFATISVGHIHLGQKLERIGDQPCDLSGVSPRIGKRAYTVAEGNTHYKAIDGHLLTHSGNRLLFFSPPYTERVSVPEGVVQIDATALCEGCGKPQLVFAPETLARVGSREFDDAVWVCPETAAARKPLEDRGVRLASPQAMQLDGCWYDFDGEGAVLIAGPPAPKSVSQRFADAAAARHAGIADERPSDAIKNPLAPDRDTLMLPREVDGRPLRRIAARALPYAPAMLVLPSTVRVVERNNACRGTKQLVLPEGLERIGEHSFCSRIFEGAVSIPKSVYAIGEGCFEYSLCRLEHTGSILHISADQLLSCFSEGQPGHVPFSFERYDELLTSGKNLPDYLGAMLHRLADPCKPAPRIVNALVEKLRDQERASLERVAREGDRAMVEALLQDGFITEKNFNLQIELLRSCNRADCVLYLMEWHEAQRKAQEGEDGAGKAKSARSRFAL